MVFSAPIFLSTFLPVVCLLYVAVSPKRRNGVLLLGSLAFYYWGAGERTLVLLWVVAVSYFGARLIREQQGRLLTAVVVAMTAAPLVWFKYAAWFSEIAVEPFRSIGMDVSPLEAQVIPVGISFFTFQSLSYVLDVRRGTAEPLDKPSRYALYIALFPQLIAGPIVRYADIREQLFTRVVSREGVAAGAARFTHGLAKKVVIADSVGLIADAVFNSTLPRSTAVAWLGITAYALQIYFDFSGYSDMAIGLGRMFGFDFPENFRRPYSSLSITDFWRRWHITLSSWFRDYVYIPLGGSRNGTLASYRNLLLVFLLTALWHGAAFTFLVWGAIHGASLVIERATGLRDTTRLPALRRLLTLLIVLVAWVFFRAADVSSAGRFVRDMFSWSTASTDPTVAASLTGPALIALGVGLATLALPHTFVVGRAVADGVGTFAPDRIRFVTVSLGLPLALVFVAANESSPFLYFQF
jgi:alginate O-acetyltransferase complex protein AlgI